MTVGPGFRAMHAGGGVALALLAATVLAGCSDGGGDDLAKAAAELDVAATATTGVIRGVTVDEALRPIAGAAVQLVGGAATTSNDDGAFGFEGLPPGTYFLTVSADGYAAVQQSAEVLAGVSDPEPLRVLLAAVPRLEPFIEALAARLYVIGAVSTPVVFVRLGDVVGDEGNFAFDLPVTPNGTLAQAEFLWEPSTPLGQELWVGGGTYAGDDDVDEVDGAGPSPLVLRANATDGGDTADRVFFHMWSDDAPGQPVGLHLQQRVDAFVHVFHNFRPGDGWTFARDGPHPLPP